MGMSLGVSSVYITSKFVCDRYGLVQDLVVDEPARQGVGFRYPRCK